MAVEAQYPSNVLFLNRSLQESNKGNFPIHNQTGKACMDQIQTSPMMIFRANGNGNANINSNGRNQPKRRRDTSSTLTAAPVDSFLPQPQQQQQTLELSQLPNTNNMNHLCSPPEKDLRVFNSLKLSISDHHQHQQMVPNPNPNLNQSSFLSDYTNHQMKQQQYEIDQLLHFQGEQLQRVLSDNRQRQYRSLLTATEESIVRRLREKQGEFQKAIRRNAELEARAVQLSMEAQAWQAKARAQESAAASLKSQLQQALINGGRRDGDGAEEGHADDAESVYIDPDRVVAEETQNFGPVCKACRCRPASVVLLPCRHLCVCVACDGAVVACPYCFTMKNTSVEVFLA